MKCKKLQLPKDYLIWIKIIVVALFIIFIAVSVFRITIPSTTSHKCVIHYQDGETDTVEYETEIGIRHIYHVGIDGHDIVIYQFSDGRKSVIHDPDCWCLPYLDFLSDTIDYN